MTTLVLMQRTCYFLTERSQSMTEVHTENFLNIKYKTSLEFINKCEI